MAESDQQGGRLAYNPAPFVSFDAAAGDPMLRIMLIPKRVVLACFTACAALLLLLAAGVTAPPSGTAQAADLTPPRTPTLHGLATATPTPRATPPAVYSSTPVATSTKLTATPTPTSTVTPTPMPATSTPTTPNTEPLQPGATPGPTATPRRTEPCSITMEIVTDQDAYWLTEQATMPRDIQATAKVSGLCDDLSVDDLRFVWLVSIAYNPTDYDPVNAPARSMRYVWPPQRSEGADTFTPDFGRVVRGGTLTLAAVTYVDGLLYSARTSVPLLGTNPSRAVLEAYFAREFPASHSTLWRIAQAESELRQFRDDGHPNWSRDQHQGVGIMQITNPAPTDDEIWSWKANADAGSRVLQGAYAVARNWPSTVARSREFTVAFDAYNTAREKAELPKLARATVPEFSSGNLLCNLQQRELDAIRLYNGAGGTDPLGLPLHEYRLAYDREQNLLDLDVNEDALTATAKWVRVAAEERPASSGVQDYVGRILARPALGCR